MFALLWLMLHLIVSSRPVGGQITRWKLCQESATATSCITTRLQNLTTTVIELRRSLVQHQANIQRFRNSLQMIQDVNPCSSGPCSNRGTCSSSGSTYTCSCAASFAGTNCESYVDPCLSGPCSNNGTCISAGATFTCACTALYTDSRCTTMRVQCLTDIQVSYNREMPSNAIRVHNGGSADINRGKKGDYVWLIPVWGSTRYQVVTHIHIHITGREIPGLSDLARGAGGDFRYLRLSRSDATSTCITGLALFRTGNDGSYRGGWPYCTGDINRGRRGDFLYLCWSLA